MKNLILLVAIFGVGITLMAQNSSKNADLENLIGEWKLQSDWGANRMEFSLIKESEKKEEDYSIKNTIQFASDGKIIKATYGVFGCGTAYVMNLRLFDMIYTYSKGKIHLKGEFSDYRGSQLLDKYYEIQREENKLILTEIISN